jgi:hypothetical protein
MVAEPEIGMRSTAESPVRELPGAELHGAMPIGAESAGAALILKSLGGELTGGFPLGGSVTGIGLLSLKGDCATGNAVGVCASVRVRGGAGEVSGAIESLLFSGTRSALWTGEDGTDADRGSSEGLLGSDEGGVFVSVSGGADDACTSADGVVETVCDRADGG